MEVLRFPIEWAQVEPEPGVYDWGAIDAIVGGAAVAGIDPLPFVWSTPAWLNPQKSKPPLGSAAEKRAWQGFLAALAARYGSGDRPLADLERGQLQALLEAEALAPRLRGAARALREDPALRRPRRRDPARRRRAGEARDAPVGVPRGPLPREGRRALVRHRRRPPVLARALRRRVPDPPGPRRDRGRRRPPRPDPRHRARLGLRRPRPGPDDQGPRGPGEDAREVVPAARPPTAAQWRIEGIDWHSFQDVGPDGGEPVCSFCPGSGLVTAAREPKPAWEAFGRFAGR